MKRFIAGAAMLAASPWMADAADAKSAEARAHANGLRAQIRLAEPHLMGSLATLDQPRYFMQVLRPMAAATRDWDSWGKAMRPFEYCKLAALDMTSFMGLADPRSATWNSRKIRQYAEDLALCDHALSKR
jgi:hypothetical protein